MPSLAQQIAADTSGLIDGIVSRVTSGGRDTRTGDIGRIVRQITRDFNRYTQFRPYAVHSDVMQRPGDFVAEASVAKDGAIAVPRAYTDPIAVRAEFSTIQNYFDIK